jgi:[ribosomal protein S18]-alanine N-acetyltransferase
MPPGNPVLVVRRAAPQDLATLAALADAGFDPDYGEAWSQADLATILPLQGCWALLAEKSSRPAGMALIRQVADEAELLLITVHPALRRQGIARQLLEQCRDQAQKNGANSLFLEVRANNAAALSFYEHAGFANVGRRPGYYQSKNGDRIDAFNLKMDL